MSLINVPIQYLKNQSADYYLKKYLSSDPKSSKSQYVLISDFKRLYRLKSFIRSATDQHIFIALNASTLQKIFKNSSKSSDNILKFFGRLCGPKTVLFLPEYSQLSPGAHFHYLEQYLISTKQIVHLK